MIEISEKLRCSFLIILFGCSYTFWILNSLFSGLYRLEIISFYLIWCKIIFVYPCLLRQFAKLYVWLWISLWCFSNLTSAIYAWNISCLRRIVLSTHVPDVQFHQGMPFIGSCCQLGINSLFDKVVWLGI